MVLSSSSDSITNNDNLVTPMFLKTAVLTDGQKIILRKALMLYVSNVHKKHHNMQLSDNDLTGILEQVDSLSDALHLKHVNR